MLSKIFYKNLAQPAEKKIRKIPASHAEQDFTSQNLTLTSKSVVVPEIPADEIFF